MAAGFQYPAEFQTAEGQIVVGGTVQFTSDDEQPGSFFPAAVDCSLLPTADPHVLYQLWNDAGVLTMSSG